MQALLADLKRAACTAFGLEEVDTRLWDYYHTKLYGRESLDNRLHESLDTAKILRGQDMLLEEKVSVPSHPLIPLRASSIAI